MSVLETRPILVCQRLDARQLAVALCRGRLLAEGVYPSRLVLWGSYFGCLLKTERDLPINKFQLIKTAPALGIVLSGRSKNTR